jgi:short-subunit dehydrogenase
MKQPKNIAITGASSGIGAALARHYAASGVTLYLHGRNAQNLAKTALECEQKGAKCHAHIGDITDKTDVSEWLIKADKNTPLDLVIANAGISAGIGGGGETVEQTRAIFATNIDGVVNTIHPLIPNMVTRKRGQLAIVSSLAGIRGLASSPAYSASKAAVRVLGEGLRGWLKPHGVEVNVICPGFIRTPLTDVNPYKMPFLMEPDYAARIIAEGLAKNKARIAFPWQLYLPLLLATLLPLKIIDPLIARLPGKPSTSSRP